MSSGQLADRRRLPAVVGLERPAAKSERIIAGRGRIFDGR
jgi:hypothetical protein